MGFLRALNEGVYRVERMLIALCFGFMAVTVFVDTVHGGIDHYSVAACGNAGAAACGKAWGLTAGLALVLFFIGFAAIRARRRQQKAPLAGAWLPAIAVAVVGAAFLQALLWLFPQGWSWSSQLALGLLLWVSLLGSSLVTKERRHIHVEAVKKFLPEKVQRFTGFIANLLAAALCGFVAIIGAMFTAKLYSAWAASEGRAAILEQVPWMAEWMVALAVPTTFGVMALRFVGHGVGALRGDLGPVEKELADAQQAAERLHDEEPG